MKRLLAVILLLVLGILSLPLAALPFDGEGSEGWILPLQLGAMALVGAAVGLAVPELAGESPAGSAGRGRTVAVGVGAGLAAAVVGLLVFWLLLNGFDGA